MTFSKDDSAGYLINHMARIFAQGLTARIRPLGLTIGTFPALLELWQGDGLSQKQLVVRLGIEQATMANTLNRMERDGLITRRKDPEDRRSQQVWLTDQARALRDPAIAAAEGVNRDLLSALTPDEAGQLLALMRKVIQSEPAEGDALSNPED